MKKILFILIAVLSFCACEPEDVVLSGDTVRIFFGAVKAGQRPLQLTLINRDLVKYQFWNDYQKASDGSGRKIVLATMGLQCHGCDYLAADMDALSTQYQDQGLEFIILFYETEEDREKLAGLPYIQALQNISAYYNSKDYPIERYMWSKTIPGVHFIDNGVLWEKGHIGWYGGEEGEESRHQSMLQGLRDTIDEFASK